MKNKIIKLVIAFMFFPMLANSQTEKFDEFIDKFCTDSSFQVSRTKFPLLCISWSFEENKETEIYIKKESYKFDKLFYYVREYSEAYTIFYDNFDCKIPDTDEMVFRWKGFTDMDRRYYFKRINGIWFLVKMLDYDLEE